MQTLASKLSYVHFLFIFSAFGSLPSRRQYFSLFSPFRFPPFSLLVFCCSAQVFALLLFPFHLPGACVLVMHFISFTLWLVLYVLFFPFFFYLSSITSLFLPFSSPSSASSRHLALPLSPLSLPIAETTTLTIWE